MGIVGFLVTAAFRLSRQTRHQEDVAGTRGEGLPFPAMAPARLLGIDSRRGF